MKSSSPVEMQPRGEGRERVEGGVVGGGELACSGPARSLPRAHRDGPALALGT